MIYRTLLLLLSLSASLLATPAALAAESSAETATIVVYRADESIKTERLRYDLHVNQGSYGRLQADSVIVLQQQPGTYTLGTSMSEGAPLVLELKPGSVHYVHSRPRLRGSSVSVSMQEVQEQVARSHHPEEIDGTI